MKDFELDAVRDRFEQFLAETLFPACSLTQQRCAPGLPQPASMRQLVRLGKIRWQIEQGYQQLKEELGLDHFEGRSWIGWNRHVTLTMVAFAFLVRKRLWGQKRGAKLGPP